MAFWHKETVHHEASKAAYESFIATLSNMCERANQGLEKQDDPQNSIELQKQSSTPENRLHSFSTSKRFYKIVPTLSSPFEKIQHYKHVRVISFTDSPKMGKCDISIKDVCLIKTRMNHHEPKNASRLSNSDFSHAQRVFSCNISDLNKYTADKIFGWLLFKNELNSLPFYKEQVKEKSRFELTTTPFRAFFFFL